MMEDKEYEEEFFELHKRYAFWKTAGLMFLFYNIVLIAIIFAMIIRFR